MNIFLEIPNNLVLSASKRVLFIKAEDLVNRFIDVFDVPLDMRNYLLKLPPLPDTPKFRHWLAVTKNMVRSRIKGLDPEPQFISHFIVDSLEPSRIAELHGIRGLELLVDNAISDNSELIIDLPKLFTPPKFNIWGLGTVCNEDTQVGFYISVRADGSVSCRFGDYEFNVGSKFETDANLSIERDLKIHSDFGESVIASNIQGLGDAYHSNAPVVRKASALSQWGETLNKSIALLATLDRSVASGCLELSKAICPLHCGSTSFGSSSPAEIIGLTFLPGVLNHLDVMECLLHESLHQKLYHAEEGSSLFEGENGDEEIYYSPWRPDARPLRMLVHGAFVFTGVAQMWKMIAQREELENLKDEALFHVHYRVGQVKRAIDVVGKYGLPTSLGSKIVDLILRESRDVVSEVKFPNYYANESERRQHFHFESHSIFKH